MTRKQTLELDGHQLVPASVLDGAVRTWECAECGHTAEDAYDYIGVECFET